MRALEQKTNEADYLTMKMEGKVMPGYVERLQQQVVPLYAEIARLHRQKGQLRPLIAKGETGRAILGGGAIGGTAAAGLQTALHASHRKQATILTDMNARDIIKKATADIKDPSEKPAKKPEADDKYLKDGPKPNKQPDLNCGTPVDGSGGCCGECKSAAQRMLEAALLLKLGTSSALVQGAKMLPALLGRVAPAAGRAIPATAQVLEHAAPAMRNVTPAAARAATGGRMLPAVVDVAAEAAPAAAQATKGLSRGALIGGGSMLGAGGLMGAYGMGRSGGYSRGFEQGGQQGWNLGQQIAMQNMANSYQDSGFLSRLMDLFAPSGGRSFQNTQMMPWDPRLSRVLREMQAANR